MAVTTSLDIVLGDLVVTYSESHVPFVFRVPACLVSPLVVSPLCLSTCNESLLVYAAATSAVVRSGVGEGAPSDGDVHGTLWSRLREEVRHYSK